MTARELRMTAAIDQSIGALSTLEVRIHRLIQKKIHKPILTERETELIKDVGAELRQTIECLRNSVDRRD